MKRFVTPALLLVAGALLVVIGGFLLVDPHEFFGQNGVVLGDDPNLMSEIRAPAGLLIASGLLIAWSARIERLGLVGLALTALVYGSYGVSRLVSIGLDGLPSEGIVAATLVELVVGGFAMVSLVIRSRTESA